MFSWEQYAAEEEEEDYNIYWHFFGQLMIDGSDGPPLTRSSTELVIY